MWVREISKKGFKDAEEPQEELKIPVYGGVSIDEDEATTCRLPPKFTMFSKIEEGRCKMERLMAHTKTRWSRRGTGSPEDQKTDEETYGEEETDEQVIMENENREIYNPDTKTLNFNKLKATDMKDCPRVGLPGPRPKKEEELMNAKEVIWSEEIENYKREFCKENDEQKEENMTQKEKKGMKKLLERQKSKEIVIGTTYKSSKRTVNSHDNYIQQGEPHVSKDKIVD